MESVVLNSNITQSPTDIVNQAEDIVPTAQKDRSFFLPECCHSQKFKIAILVLGLLLFIGGLVAAFVLMPHLGSTSIYLMIPSILGLVQIAAAIFVGKASPQQKFTLMKKLCITTLDLIDDGQINGSVSLPGLLEDVQTDGNTKASKPALVVNGLTISSELKDKNSKDDVGSQSKD